MPCRIQLVKQTPYFKRVQTKGRSYVEKVLQDLEIDRDFARQSAVPAPPVFADPPAPNNVTAKPAEPIPMSPSPLPTPVAPRPSATDPSPATEHDQLIQQARARCLDAPTANAMEVVLRLLLASSGRAGVDLLAARTSMPRFRIAGLIAKLGDHLASDLRDVLRFDHQAQEAVLNLAALRQSLSPGRR